MQPKELKKQYPHLTAVAKIISEIILREEKKVREERKAKTG